MDSSHKGSVMRSVYLWNDVIMSRNPAECDKPMFKTYTFPTGMHHWRRYFLALQWRHNQREGISNHLCLDCFLNRLLWRRSEKTSKLHVTGFCEGNQLMTGGFPSQRASNAENASISWRHHECCHDLVISPNRRYFISSHEAPLGAKWHVLWRQQVELISPANRSQDQYKEGMGNL